MNAEASTIGVPSKRPKHSKRLDIQGLRAIAVILVVIEHARWGLAGGFTGVDIFFVISGFVITLSLLGGLEKTGKIKFRSFYKRRIFRLMPAATLVTLATALIAVMLVSPLGLQQQAAATGGAALLWASNIALYFISSDYFSPHVQANPFLHTWSLGVEEQFYVFFPLVLAIGWAIGKKVGISPRRMLVGIVALVGVLSFALSLTTSFGNTIGIIPNPDTFAFYMMPTRAWEFAVGVLLALAVTNRKVSPTLPSTTSAVFAGLGLVSIAAGAVFITQAMHFPGYSALIPVLGTALFIFGGVRSNPVSSFIACAPLRWVGDRSYSLYLWHWPMIVFTRRIWPDSNLAIIGAVLAAVVLADLTFRYVENPAKNFGYAPLRWRTSRTPLFTYLAAGIACTALLAGSLISWNIPSLKASTDQLNQRPIGYSECLSVIPVSQRNFEPCTWGSDRTGEPIYLVGDSNAQQYTEALIGASEKLGRPLTIATWGGCAFFDTNRHDITDPTKGLECSAYVRDGTEWLSEQPSGTVLMANAGTSITSDGVILDEQTSHEAKSEVWEHSLREQISVLKEYGHHSVLIQMTPHFPDADRGWWHPADCSNSNLVNDPQSCAVTLDADQIQQQRSLTLSAETAAAQDTNTPEIDPADFLCPDGCTTFSEGLWVYRDGLHISPEQSSRMAGWFASRLDH